jgi:hypothetical protein
MGEEPKSYIHSDPIKYTAKKGVRRSKSYNSFTFSYETPRKKISMIQRILNDV